MPAVCIYVLSMVAVWSKTQATHVYIEGEEVETTYEVPAFKWFPQRYSLETYRELLSTDSAQCNFIQASLKSAMSLWGTLGLLTSSEIHSAFLDIDRCREDLCSNFVTLDGFMGTSVYTEQLDLLYAQAKYRSSVELDTLKYLVDPRYKEIIANTTFPYVSPSSFESERQAAFNVIENVCGPQEQSVADFLTNRDVTTIFLFILVDKYTSDAINETDMSELLKCSSLETFDSVWGRITRQMSSPTSNFATSCLDPAVAFYDLERSTVTRIRRLADSMGVPCGVIKTDAFYSYYDLSTAPSDPSTGAAAAAPADPSSAADFDDPDGFF